MHASERAVHSRSCGNARRQRLVLLQHTVRPAPPVPSPMSSSRRWRLHYALCPQVYGTLLSHLSCALSFPPPLSPFPPPSTRMCTIAPPLTVHAMTTAPNVQTPDRWTVIASLIPGKTKAQCVARCGNSPPRPPLLFRFHLLCPITDQAPENASVATVPAACLHNTGAEHL